MQFIVSTDANTVDAGTRKLIRSHVMVGKNRGKSRRHKQTRAGGYRSEAQPYLTDPQGILYPAIARYNSTIPQRIGSDLSLNNFAVEMRPVVLEDVKRFAAASVMVLFPMVMLIAFDVDERAWFEDLMSDAPYLHIIVFTGAAFMSKFLGRQGHMQNQEVTLHLMKGIRMLRERLNSGDAESQNSNSTVRSVLLLAIGAYMLGDYRTAKYHMNGLRRIVDLRGGLSAFRANKLMLELLRCDIEMALHDGSEPLFYNHREPFLPFPDQTMLPVQQDTGIDCSRYDVERDVHRMDPDLAAVWRVMHRFSSHINFLTDTHKQLSFLLLQDIMASVVYRLLFLNFESGSSDEAIRLSLLAFSYHIFLQWQDMSLPHAHYPLAFQDCLLGLQIVGTDDCSPQCTLWCLMVGAISVSTAAKDKDGWLKMSIRKHIDLCGIHSWDDMRDILKSFMWIDLLHDRPGRAIFDDAMRSSIVSGS